MLAIALADAWLEKFGGDSLAELRRNYDAYLATLARQSARKDDEHSDPS
jgi:chorismate synthase